MDSKLSEPNDGGALQVGAETIIGFENSMK